MRSLIGWKDRQVEYPHRVVITDNADGTKTITRFPGKVEEEGTPQKESNFNNMDWGIFEAMQTAMEAARAARLVKMDVDGLESEEHEVTVTNSYAYPFNNSVATIRLDKLRNKRTYTVNTEVESVDGDAGCSAGTVEIYDKLNNGFKVHFTGSAKSAKIKFYVRGGF